MKKLVFSLLAAATVVVLSGCSNAKQVVYFQNADYTSLAASKVLVDARIMPKDILTITVSTSDPKAAQPFNLTVASPISTTGSLSSGGQGLQNYVVDNKGCIRFPIIGERKVAGLTVRECEELLKGEILPYMAVSENPIVTVKLSSYHVTVIGEVGDPGIIPVSSEKMNIVEALAEAGDLTIYGKRENIMLIREDSYGEKSIHRLDLTDVNLINSPYYYLQQNDIIYVEPQKVKTYNASINSNVTLWLGIITSTLSVVTLIVNLAD